MTLYDCELGDLDNDADLLVDRIFNTLIRELRARYGTTVPTDDRLADVEIAVRNLIYQHVPKARARYNVTGETHA
jgi:hypothetical protein